MNNKYIIYFSLALLFNIGYSKEIYQSIPTPIQIRNFSLSVYQCFAEAQDGINELERYTKGYVESYLHDGKEMLRKANEQRLFIRKEKEQLNNII